MSSEEEQACGFGLTRPVCTQPWITAARQSVTIVTRSGRGCCQNPRSLCSRMAFFSSAVIPLIRFESQKRGICWYRATCAALRQKSKSGSSLLILTAKSFALFSSRSGEKCARGLSILQRINFLGITTEAHGILTRTWRCYQNLSLAIS